MQLVLNARNIAVGAALVVGGLYGYRSFYAGIDTRDVGKLIAAHRTSSPARRHIIRRRILEVYQSSQHYATVCRALRHRHPVTQAFAVQILAAKHERKALPQLLQMLAAPHTGPRVKAELARAFAQLPTLEAVPCLIALTSAEEEPAVRRAAHQTLVSLLGTGGQIRYGDGMRQRWSDWWEQNRRHVRLR